MKRNFLPSLLVVSFSLILVFSAKTPPVAAAFSPATLLVNPQRIADPMLGVGSTFSVSVDVKNATDLYGYEFKLGYVNSVLTATSISKGDFFAQESWVVSSGIKDDEGFVWISVTMPLGSQQGTNGDGVLATVTFTVDSVGYSTLNLYDTKLSDSAGEPIFHDVVDGYFGGLKHDVAITRIAAYPDSVIQGEPAYIIVAVENHGDFTETFEVFVYTERWGNNEKITIGGQTVADMLPGASVDLLFVWDTTNVAYGTYSFSAMTSLIPSETYTVDNVILRGAKIAGVCAQPFNGVNPLEKLAPIAATLFSIGGLGIVAVGFLRTLSFDRLPLPSRLMKRTVFTSRT